MVGPVPRKGANDFSMGNFPLLNQITPESIVRMAQNGHYRL